jgi:hypothetical protein
VAIAAASAGAFALTRDRGETVARTPNAARADGLTLLIADVPGGPFGAVIGSTGGEDGALVVPAETQITIPGQGDGTVGEALGLPPADAGTAVANLLGVGVDHSAVLDRKALADVVDRAGGIEVGGGTMSGAEVVAMLGDAGAGGTAAFEQVVNGLLQSDATWTAPDLAEADDPPAVARSLSAATGAAVSTLPVSEVADGVVQADPEATRQALVEAFGGPDRKVIGVIVLNGSGVPGIGQLVAERIVPGGFRVVVSQNAATFDHQETLVVVGSADDVALGERVRDLLGTGSVNVSVGSGIAPVTIVVGKDFEG